jgi:hypothetical protein
VTITSDAELQSLINQSSKTQSRQRKQMVKEFEIVDGFPVLDEWEHLELSNQKETSLPRTNKPYSVDFRMPLKGLSRQLLSPTQLNVCNMFSTLYFLQLVVIARSSSLKVPGYKQSKSQNGYQVIES